MSFIKCVSVLVVLLNVLSCSHAPIQSLPTENLELGRWDTAILKENDGVILIPQWHFSPQDNTRLTKRLWPQQKNQTAIYQNVQSWIQDNYIQTIFVEGCEGTIESLNTTHFNGWTLNELKELPKDEIYDSVLTHLGTKLFARNYGANHESISILCADQMDLIKKHQLALSDIRGFMGFKLRLEQKKLSEKDRLNFLKGARDVLGLPPTALYGEVVSSLKKKLYESLDRYEQLIVSRNNVFVEHLKKAQGRRVLIVGSLHIEQLKMQLAEQKIKYQVWIPVGLEDDDAQLILNLKKRIH